MRINDVFGDNGLDMFVVGDQARCSPRRRHSLWLSLHSCVSIRTAQSALTLRGRSSPGQLLRGAALNAVLIAEAVM